MARRHDFQHTSTLRRQTHLAPRTNVLRSGKHPRDATLMIMARSRKKNHVRISLHLISQQQLDTLYRNR
jgi:hypothetical protein